MTSHALHRAFAAGVLALGLTAQAAPVYLIDATTNGLAPAADFSNVAFSLTFEDLNLDTLFSLGELLTFTGVYDAATNYFDVIAGLPTVPGILGNGAVYRFQDSAGLLADFSVAANTYTVFSAALLPNLAVPEPGALALCLTGLAALVLTRRSASSKVAG